MRFFDPSSLPHRSNAVCLFQFLVVDCQLPQQVFYSLKRLLSAAMTPAKCKRRDEEDEELLLSIGMMQVFLLLICLMASLIDVRAPPLPQQRLDWSDCVEKRNCDPAFRCHLRMSFEKLLSYIRTDLEVRVKARIGGSKRA